MRSYSRRALALVLIAAMTACEDATAPDASLSGVLQFTGYTSASLQPMTIPIPGATIKANGLTTSGETDGTFTLSGLKAGTIAVSIAAPGFADTTITVALSGGPNSVTATMRPVPDVFLGDASLRMSGPGVARTALYYKLPFAAAIGEDPVPNFTTTGPFSAARGGNDRRTRSVVITATGPGSGSVTVEYQGKSATIQVEAVALKFKTINVGTANACGIATDDSAWCWGGNYSGQLGASTPYLCNGAACQYGGREGNETPLPVRGGKFATVATMGNACASFGPVQTCGRSCALTGDGQPWCWGETPQQMAIVSLKTLSLRSAGINSSIGTCGLGVTGKAHCFTATTLTTEGGGMTFQSYSAGATHSCGVDAAGDVYCWGANTKGELGIGVMDAQTHSTPEKATGSVKFSAVEVEASSTCALATTGAIYCWGVGFTASGETPPPACSSTTELCQLTPRAVTGARTYVSLSRGPSMTCGLTGGGAVDCWTSLNSPPASPPLPSLTMISVGSASTGYSVGLPYSACGLTADGMAYCWAGTSVTKIAQP